jgi:hypothetical protein
VRAKRKEVASSMLVREKKLGAILLRRADSLEVCNDLCDAIMVVDLRGCNF